MPSAARRPCTAPGCGVLVQGGSRCDKHPVQQWMHRKPVKRITGRKLQRIRAEVFTADPLCALCRNAAAVIVDHKVPLAEGGEDEPHNRQGLCDPCHDAKSKAEAMRGRGGRSNV